MIWIVLFVGLTAGGLNARTTLLAYRGGILFEGANRYSIFRNMLELTGTATSIAGFVVSFFLFVWWIPIIAFIAGFWIIPPFVVNHTTFVPFYRASPIISLISCTCAAFVIFEYFV